MRCLHIVLALVLVLSASAEEVRRIVLPERLTRGNTSIVPLSPIDEAFWLAPRDTTIGPGGLFCKFRTAFEADGNSVLRFHVSADERFILVLDGAVIARGPDRGEPNMWFFQSYETRPTKGIHVMEAIVWKLNNNQSPNAQLSWKLGFVLAAEGVYDARITTGKGAWQVGALTQTVMTRQKYPLCVGAQCVVSGTDLIHEEPLAFEEPIVVRPAIRPNPSCSSRQQGWLVYPSQLPEQISNRIVPGACVAVDGQAFVTNGIHFKTRLWDEWGSNAVFCAASGEDSRREDFNSLLRGERTLVIPPQTTVRYLWNLGQYYCAYPEMRVSGGKGSAIQWGWSEALYEGDCFDWHTVVTDKVRKGLGDRNSFVGKYFYGIADLFRPSGNGASFYSAPWWHCGKFCLLEIKTGDEPLTIEHVGMTETRYPLDPEAYFHCSDDSLDAVQAVCLRGMQMCMHDMHFDCPYYEQQMYGGDTRLQMLMTQVLSPDDRLNRQAFRLFEVSQRDSGMVSMNYPTKWLQESTTFSEYWAMMLGDYALRRDNPAWVRSRLPAVRKLLFNLEGLLNEDGLQANAPGWCFVDWVPHWDSGKAPEDGEGVSAVNNLLYLLALQKVAVAEESVGERELAARWRRRSTDLGGRIFSRFWCEERGLVADTAAKNCFSEHAQALAILTGLLTPERQARVVRGLERDADLAQCTASFSSYLFEAYFACGRADLFLKKLDVWREYVRMGLHTPLEGPGDARSDCHAWSSNPIYHLHTGLAGVNPAEAGFKSVRVAPCPGPLKWIKSKTSTPRGYVVQDLAFDKDQVTGCVELPLGLSGTFVWQGHAVDLAPGENRIELKGGLK